jgi:hypothetical protein
MLSERVEKTRSLPKQYLFLPFLKRETNRVSNMGAVFENIAYSPDVDQGFFRGILHRS